MGLQSVSDFKSPEAKFTIILKCDDMAGNCRECLKLDEEHGCVWCQVFILEGFLVGFLAITLFCLKVTQRCEIPENCAAPAPDALMKRGQECPSATTIASVSPAMLEKSSARYRHTI